MKTILLLICVAMAGCSANIPESFIEGAYEKCKSNGGLMSITVNTSHETGKEFYYANCKNGARFHRSKL